MRMDLRGRSHTLEYQRTPENHHHQQKRQFHISIQGLVLETLPPMASKVKGIFKGIKYITQIFVYKEHEMEIGYPTDVRHVAHIGWDSTSMHGPSWMNEFKAASDFSSTSLSISGQSRETSWTSQDFEMSRGPEPSSDIYIGRSIPEIPKAPKKTKRKKMKVSSPSSSTRSSTRSSKSHASYATAIDEVEDIQSQIRVA